MVGGRQPGTQVVKQVKLGELPTRGEPGEIRQQGWWVQALWLDWRIGRRIG